jgi:hypothetical protein
LRWRWAGWGDLYTHLSWCLPGVGGGMSRLHGVRQLDSNGVNRLHNDETHLDCPPDGGQMVPSPDSSCSLTSLMLVFSASTAQDRSQDVDRLEQSIPGPRGCTDNTGSQHRGCLREGSSCCWSAVGRAELRRLGLGAHDTGMTMASPVSGELGCDWGMHVSA